MAYSNEKPSASNSAHRSKVETYTMFLRQDGAGSVYVTPAPSQQCRSNQHGFYRVLSMDIYPHIVHITKVLYCHELLYGLLPESF